MNPIAKLKIDVSPIIIQYIAKENGMTVGEFGKVYQSEEYEDMLNRIVKEVLYFRERNTL